MQVFPAGTPQFLVPVVFMVKTFAVYIESKMDHFIHFYIRAICQNFSFKSRRVKLQKPDVAKGTKSNLVKLVLLNYICAFGVQKPIWLLLYIRLISLEEHALVRRTDKSFCQ